MLAGLLGRGGMKWFSQIRFYEVIVMIALVAIIVQLWLLLSWQRDISGEISYVGSRNSTCGDRSDPCFVTIRQ
jgi:hypothetical protein